MLNSITRRSHHSRADSHQLFRKRRNLHRWLIAGAALLAGTSAAAQETITYSYDALGRLVAVNHTGGTNNGVAASYTYDRADNRTNVTVTGAPANGGNGAPAPPRLFIVVPLNGYTLITVQ